MNLWYGLGKLNFAKYIATSSQVSTIQFY